MGRHKQFDETAALASAMSAFWSRGYDGTSLQHLETAMGLTRTSIYNAFGNKRQLFDKALMHYKSTVLVPLFAPLQSQSTVQDAMMQVLDKVLDLHFARYAPGGCLMVLSALERAQHEASSISFVEQAFAQLQKKLQQRLKQAQQLGELAPSADPAALSVTLVTVVAGLLVLGKAGFSRANLGKVNETISCLLAAQ